MSKPATPKPNPHIAALEFYQEHRLIPAVAPLHIVEAAIERGMLLGVNYAKSQVKALRKRIRKEKEIGED